jgi:preprotein translocase subunit SecG
LLGGGRAFASEWGLVVARWRRLWYHQTIVLEVEIVHLFLEIMLLVFSVGLILVVLLQKGKSAGLSGAISGGAEQLFGKQKARGLDLFMSRLTMVLAVGFFVTALLLSYVFTK